MNRRSRVRIVSLGFHDEAPARIVKQVDREGARGVDLLVLPETFNMLDRNRPETLEGPLVTAMSELARRHRMYVVCPIDRLRDGVRLNSAVLLDRAGQVLDVYDKVYPYWSEFEVDPPIHVPAGRAHGVDTDFGRIGMAICFDVNFPAVWADLAADGVDLVVWPSAYSAGRSLQAHAINHNYHIVTATYRRDCLVYDITGEEILYERSEDFHVSRFELDMDRGIYHENFNLRQRDRLLREHAADIEMEQWLPREQWFVLRARRAGVGVRELARRYGLEELRDYKLRSQRQIDAMRRRQPGHQIWDEAAVQATSMSLGVMRA